MSDSNEITLDKALIAEEKGFVIALEKLTTLKKPEIVSLAKIYGLGGFFQKYAGRIVEKQLGGKIAEIVLFILKIRAIRTEFREGICKTANENPKLTAGLQSYLMDQTIGEAGEKKDCKRPTPAPVNAFKNIGGDNEYSLEIGPYTKRQRQAG